MNLIVLKQWFLTKGHASLAGANKFPAEHELLCALQHRKFDQKIYQQIHLLLQLI